MSYQDSGIKGWTSLSELRWLHAVAPEMGSIAEVGSWHGRSTHALLEGCSGTVWAVDTWQPDYQGWWGWLPGWGGDPFGRFLENVGQYPNLRICRSDSLAAAEMFTARGITFDMIFLDGDHSEEGTRVDIDAWRPLCRRLLCGHDYRRQHVGVRRAVDEMLGRVGHVGGIWYTEL